MAPVVNTYGVKKKKRGRLPKFLFQEDPDNDDVFESLNIENIKETKALLEEKGKLKSKKKRTTRQPFYSLGCSNDADSTFDRLLKEGPIRSCGSPQNSPDSTLSSSSSSSDSSDFLPKKRILGKKKTRKIVKEKWITDGALPKRGRKQSKKSLEDSFFTKVNEDIAKLKKQRKGTLGDSFFNLEENTNGPDIKITSENNKAVAVASPLTTKRQLEMLSPILPVNFTSTPHGNKQFSLNPRFLSCDAAMGLSESLPDKKPGNGSVDMFGSFECRENPDPLQVNCEAVSVDMFSSLEQNTANNFNVSNSSQANHELGIDLSRISSVSPIRECKAPLVQPEASCIILDETENVSVGEDVSHVDVTGCATSDASYLRAGVQDEISLVRRNTTAEEAETISEVSDPCMKDCVVMLSRCDLSEQPALEASCSNMDLNNLQDNSEVSIQTENSAVFSVDSPCHERSEHIVPIKDCQVVLERYRMESIGAPLSVTADSIRCVDFEESCVAAEGENAVTDSANMEQENDEPDINQHKTTECKVILSRCDEVGGVASFTGVDTELSSEAMASQPASFVRESLGSPVCARPSLVMRHSVTPEPVVLKPGKHWRRSLSILSKIRTSLESSGRKSLASNDGVKKGKRWESSVNSLIQLQSNRGTILEDLEESGCSLLNESQAKVVSHSNLEEDSIVICETSQTDALTSSCAVLRRCGQEAPLSFLECYPSSMKEQCKKIGEGVYGEVFLYSESGNPVSVIKIIPIEGALEVNGEPQKTFGEIFSEVCVAQELSNLRKGRDNSAWTFNEVQAIRCVQGSYPDWLQELWHDYNDTKGSENDCPDIFQEDQLFIVLELRHGGKDLESFVFSSADQGLAAFKQIALTLAVGEKALKFEHRDLHWGNVLLASTKTKTVDFILNGETRSVPSKGVEVSIIDFTLSRINNPETGNAVFYDLSQDETLFTAQGDYQFEIYRMMKEICGNNWDSFAPRTNIAWLHYLLDKLCTMARYRSRSSKIHGYALDKLNEMKDTVLMFNDVISFVNCPLFCK